MTSTAFISYSWDDESHKRWVNDFATRLRNDGVGATFDKWETEPGDQLPEFMEQAIANNDFILIICTPRYKARSEAREGGVGYEGHVMTAEAIDEGNHRKFIPVLRRGTWREAAPSWLRGKYHIDLSENPYSEEAYENLVRTLLGIREQPPAIGEPLATIGQERSTQRDIPTVGSDETFEDIRLTGIVVESVTVPRNDGSAGSALYEIPISLSRSPDGDWSRMFIRNWDSPPRFTSMHRPGIARIRGATVVLNGTTVEEVEKYHRNTLLLVLEETNREYKDLKAGKDRLSIRNQRMREAHKSQVEDVARRIKFD